MSTDSEIFQGSCHCRSITYTITIPEGPRPLSDPSDPSSLTFPYVDLDHCTSCRRATGVPVQAWIIIKKDWLSFTSHKDISTDTILAGNKDGNTDTGTVKHYRSSPNQENGGPIRTFCGNCGTNLTFWRTVWDVCAVTVGSLENMEEVEGLVKMNSWMGDGVEWVKNICEEGCAEGVSLCAKGTTETLIRVIGKK